MSRPGTLIIQLASEWKILTAQKCHRSPLRASRPHLSLVDCGNARDTRPAAGTIIIQMISNQNIDSFSALIKENPHLKSSRLNGWLTDRLGNVQPDPPVSVIKSPFSCPSEPKKQTARWKSSITITCYKSSTFLFCSGSTPPINFHYTCVKRFK